MRGYSPLAAGTPFGPFSLQVLDCDAMEIDRLGEKAVCYW